MDKIAPETLIFKNTLIRFEFIVDGPPVSQQTRRRERLRTWKATVRQEAEKYWSSEQKTATGLVRVQSKTVENLLERSRLGATKSWIDRNQKKQCS
ncbi:MAG: hypothetical protein QNJ55_23770 [Xenococcus sp. MO_188.B8]|nr:hypothetical protein [Xenococcus sp. MO_188.B8]